MIGGAPTPPVHSLPSGMYRAVVTKTTGRRCWVTIPNVFGNQELGASHGFEFLDHTGLLDVHATTTVSDASGEGGGDAPHHHDVVRRPITVGDKVLVAAVAGSIVDLVVLGRLRP